MGHIKNRMREAWEASGLTQAAIARQLGVTPQAVNGWFTTGRVKKSNLIAFARLVRSDFEYLAQDAQVVDDSDLGDVPTEMGKRFLQFFPANGLTDLDHFATTIGISRERLNAWIYREQKDVEVRPLLRAADALNTNPDYLLGDSDDPRVLRALDFREHQLLEAFRELAPEQQDLLLKTATAWHAQVEAPATIAQPFRTKP